MLARRRRYRPHARPLERLDHGIRSIPHGGMVRRASARARATWSTSPARSAMPRLGLALTARPRLGGALAARRRAPRSIFEARYMRAEPARGARARRACGRAGGDGYLRRAREGFRPAVPLIGRRRTHRGRARAAVGGCALRARMRRSNARRSDDGRRGLRGARGDCARACRGVRAPGSCCGKSRDAHRLHLEDGDGFSVTDADGRGLAFTSTGWDHFAGKAGKRQRLIATKSPPHCRVVVPGAVSRQRLSSLFGHIRAAGKAFGGQVNSAMAQPAQRKPRSRLERRQIGTD